MLRMKQIAVSPTADGTRQHTNQLKPIQCPLETWIAQQAAIKHTHQRRHVSGTRKLTTMNAYTEVLALYQ